VPRLHDACDLAVTHIHGPSCTISARGQSSSFGDGGSVKRQHPVLQMLAQHLYKSMRQRGAAVAWWQQRQAQPALEDRRRSDPNRLGRLPNQPGQDLRFRVGLDQLRQFNVQPKRRRTDRIYRSPGLVR
jgi:hypothetical protein